MKSNLSIIICYLSLGYLVIMSLIGFALMGIDKQKAKKKAWRIPETTLLLIAFLGGGAGSFIGMYLFHHKTKHIRFQILVPIAAILWLYAVYRLIRIG